MFVLKNFFTSQTFVLHDCIASHVQMTVIRALFMCTDVHIARNDSHARNFRVIYVFNSCIS